MNNTLESNLKPGAELMQGTVKWFNDAKGFGFIEHESGRDVFVHYSVIETEGFKTLKDGEAVLYSLAEGDKGLHAARVIRDPAMVKVQSKPKVVHTTDEASAAVAALSGAEGAVDQDGASLMPTMEVERFSTATEGEEETHKHAARDTDQAGSKPTLTPGE